MVFDFFFKSDVISIIQTALFLGSLSSLPITFFFRGKKKKKTGDIIDEFKDKINEHKDKISEINDYFDIWKEELREDNKKLRKTVTWKDVLLIGAGAVCQAFPPAAPVGWVLWGYEAGNKAADALEIKAVGNRWDRLEKYLDEKHHLKNG